MLKIPKISLYILLGILFSFIFTAQAQAADVTFSIDTELDLTGASPTLYVNSGSECDSLTVSASTLDADVPAGSTFTLETTTYTVLALTPSGGTVTLAFDTTYYSSGYVIQWTASSSVSTATTSFSVTMANANTSYQIYVDSSLYGEYTSDSNGLITFSYTGGFTSKTFTIEREVTTVTGVGRPATTPVTTGGEVTATPSLGGKTTVTSPEGETASISLPAQAVGVNIAITITPKLKTTAAVSETVAVIPEGKSIVGDYLYNYTAMTAGTAVSTFNKSVTLTFTYNDEQISGFDESTLKIYYWDTPSSEWVGLTTSVNAKTNTLTCKTSHLTYFAIIGESAVEEEEIEEEEEPEEIEYQGIPAEFSFERNLKYGQTSDEVKYLQIILKEEIGPPTYPEDVPATGWFGPVTKDSVIKFQEKYTDEILAPWGIAEGTGFVGKTTRDKINELLGEILIEEEIEEEEEPEPEEVEYEGVPSSFTFQRNLQYEVISEDVRYLQIILNSDTETKLAESGVGSPGHETNYFGPLTKAAVIRFQEKYAADILAPLGLEKGTGFFGSLTRQVINRLIGG